MPYGQRVMLCDMDKTIYGLVIYGPDGYDMDYPGLLRQLEVSRQSFSRFIKCEAAFYADEACTVGVFGAGRMGNADLESLWHFMGVCCNCPACQNCYEVDEDGGIV